MSDAFDFASDAIWDFAESLRSSNEFGFSQKQLIYTKALDELDALRKKYGVKSAVEGWGFSASDTIDINTIIPKGRA